ncbi:MAG: hypothetical protein ACI8QS_002440 [Planctomycetota bacterium]|jgi:hypothetical protein
MMNTCTQTKYFSMVYELQVGLRQEGDSGSGASNSASAIRGQMPRYRW